MERASAGARGPKATKVPRSEIEDIAANKIMKPEGLIKETEGMTPSVCARCIAVALVAEWRVIICGVQAGLRGRESV